MQEELSPRAHQAEKREVLIEIYKYLEAVPPQSPLPLKLLQQLLVMIQATFPNEHPKLL